MPIYEYKCPNGHLLEVFHGMTEPGPEKCEVCGEAPLVRVLHPVAVHYKGSGFSTTRAGPTTAPKTTTTTCTERRRNGPEGRRNPRDARVQLEHPWVGALRVVYVDTSALIALIWRRDRAHARVRDHYAKLRE